MNERESVATSPTRAESPDPGAWVEEHGDYLFRYAKFRVRETSLAEDIVQETLLAALQAYRNFAGRGSERTWLTGILKHKIMDYYRRTSRETTPGQGERDASAHDEFFRDAGEWTDHWRPEYAPSDWQADPAELLRREEFWHVFAECLSPLPARVQSAFTIIDFECM